MDEHIAGQIRHLLTAIGGAVVANGWASDAVVQIGIGVVLAIAGAIWSWKAKRAAK
jgi:hypothetical protein